LGSVKRRDLPYKGPNSRVAFEFRGPKVGNRISGLRPAQDNVLLWKPFQGTQVTESENHVRNPRDEISGETLRTLVSQKADIGGDFTTQKSYVESPEKPAYQRIDSGWYLIEPGAEEKDVIYGAILPMFPYQMPFPPSARSSNSTLNAVGTQAIAACAPTNNVASLATALLEFYREGVPKIIGASTWKSRASAARTAQSSGDEFLNVQFGWMPLVADVVDVAHGTRHLNKLLKQYVRDSGRMVRRRHSFPPIESVETVAVKTKASPSLIGGESFSTVADFATLNQGTVFRERKTTLRRWFSGAFTYHIPNDTGLEVFKHASTADRLLGIELDPETLWNLTPWSWAIDWFSDVGDLVKNVTSWSSDGLVVKYGYVMEHSIVRDTYYFSGPTGYITKEARPEIVVLVTETKLRRKATPFGFGFNFSSLTGRQKAIIAALGITRV